MDLKVYEKILARLYTEHRFRKKFFEDREELLKEFELSEYLSSKFFDLKRDEVDFFANGLINKRWGVVKNILPMINSVLKEKARLLFFNYALNKPISGFQNKHYNDSIDFAEYLIENTSVTDINIPWLKDLIKYERLIAKSSIVKNKVMFGFFDYPIYLIGKEHNDKSNFNKKKTFIILLRLTARSKLVRFIW